MLLETLLAYLHISAVLGLVVFLTAKVALLRPEVLAGQPQLLRRVLRMDNWCWASFAAVAVTGVARVLLGVKGADWYAANPVLWVKLALFAAMLAMGVPARIALLRWREASAPPTPEAIRSQRRWLMWQAHILVVLPLFGALLAYGY